MYTQSIETRAGFPVLERSAEVRDLDPSELAGISGGMPAIPPVIVTGLWILGGIGVLAVAGIAVGVGIYVWTHKH